MPAVSPGPSTAGRALTAIGAVFFLAALVIAARAFVGTFGLSSEPWSFGRGVRALAIDASLFTIFAIHHSVFARRFAREWVAALVSADLERSVYVLVASMLLVGVVGLWQPVPGQAWAVEGWPALAMRLLQLGGVCVTLAAARQLGLGRLSGLVPDDPNSPLRPLRSTGLYGFVRHPIYFAWLLMVWPEPAMTASRLTFAVLSTVYLAVAVPLEERSIRDRYGSAYDAYRRQVRWRMLPGVY